MPMLPSGRFAFPAEIIADIQTTRGIYGRVLTLATKAREASATDTARARFDEKIAEAKAQLTRVAGLEALL